jgi:hypothetical protein
MRKTFLQLVPPLPDYLSSDWVLTKFRWWGDSIEDEKLPAPQVPESDRSFGGIGAFVKEFKGEVAKVLLFSLAWVVLIFASPLSMNLVYFFYSSVVAI